MYVQQQIQRPVQENLKSHPLPMKAGNASAAFPASLLSASASLSNHFFKVPLSFGEPPVPPVPPKTPVTARTIVEIVMDRAVSIENMVILAL